MRGSLLTGGAPGRASLLRCDGGEQCSDPGRVPLRNDPEGQLVTPGADLLAETEEARVVAQGGIRGTSAAREGVGGPRSAGEGIAGVRPLGELSVGVRTVGEPLVDVRSAGEWSVGGGLRGRRATGG